MKAPQPLRMNAAVARRICWGGPDSPVRDLCALCHGALPDVPIMLWKPDGSGASFCDKCFEELISNAKT